MPRTGAIEFAEQIGAGLVRVETTPCPVCDEKHIMILDEQGYVDWQYGELIQNAFPSLTVADREVLISGTCDKCFDEMFWVDDEGEEE